MVLQRGKPVPIWGWAPANQVVTVAFADQRKTTAADESGRWQVALDPLEAGGPYAMTINAGNRLALTNILVGEVWVCSGQSNMQLPLGGTEGEGPTDEPPIRLFTTALASPSTPAEDCDGQWRVCTPQNSATFSAVGCHFGRKLQRTLEVPVGLIQSTANGSPADYWTSLEGLSAFPALTPIVSNFNQTLTTYKAAAAAYDQGLSEFLRTKTLRHASRKNDKGWERQDQNDQAWNTMKIPQQWETAGLFIDGVVWFRREVTIPAEWEGQSLQLELDLIDDNDLTYFNGEQVGDTTGYFTPRSYVIPGTGVHAGKALIAVRVTDIAGFGGIDGAPEAMRLSRVGARSGGIPLAGEWKFQVATENPTRPTYPNVDGWIPGGFYNGMIAPLAPFAIQGFIWYQGEANAGRAFQYRTLFPALIRSWRHTWKEDALPFYFVQLANYQQARKAPYECPWAELREAQFMTLSVSGTGMAVAIDIGDANSIHPLNKQDVGLRLALWALADTYGRQIECSGPLYQSMRIEANRIRIHFSHVGSGLMLKGGARLKQVAIAGEDRKFVWAEATLEANSVVVTSPQISSPAAVRYAWADNPEGCNLYNREGLPASPFRTDTWPGITDLNQ